MSKSLPQTLKDTAIVTLGNGLSTLFSVVSIFLVARILGPADYGLYITSWAIITILIDSTDLAINNAIVKFASKTSDQKDSLIKYGFLLKLFLGLILTIGFALLSRPLANWLYPSLKSPLLLASLIIITTFLFRFPRSILQSERKFFKDVIIDVSISFLRLLALIIFFFYFKLTVVTSLLAYLLAAFAGLIIGLNFISFKFLKADISIQTKSTFFHFQKWLTLGYIVAAIHGRIDSVILLKLAGPVSAGIYQAAFRFFMPILQLAAALSLVFAPRFASFAQKNLTKTYLFKATKLSLGLAFLVLLLIPLFPLLIKLIFGTSYLPAIAPARILTIGFAFFITGAPFVAHLIYSVNQIKTFFIVNLVQLILLVSLNLILIPILDASGAAWALTLTYIIINSWLACLAFHSHSRS
ncbi:MAG: oligosaccharide flippase family protein [Candidatus Beckwithbacteria bacterium]